MKYKIKAIVLACNTLSVNCYDKISKLFDIDIFKITPIVETNKKSLLLCTNATAKTLKVENNIKVLPMNNLASLIDKYYFSANKIIDNYLHEMLCKFKGYTNVILGCTHYPLVKENIRDVLGDKVEFYDQSELVINKVGAILPKKTLYNVSFKIVLTKKNKKIIKKIKKILKLD